MIKRFVTNMIQAVLLLIVPLTITFAAPAAAVNVFQVCSNGAGKTDVCDEVQNSKSGSTNPFIDLIRTAIQILAAIIGIAAVIVIVVAGLRFVSSGSDPQEVAKARGAIIYALVGLAVAALAEAIVKLLLAKL